jgi:hypothetical protein
MRYKPGSNCNSLDSFKPFGKLRRVVCEEERNLMYRFRCVRQKFLCRFHNFQLVDAASGLTSNRFDCIAYMRGVNK